MRLQLKPDFALCIQDGSFRPAGVCAHEPTKPWMLRFVTVRIVRQSLARCSPSIGWNMWIYTRWGTWLKGIVFDKRSPQQRGQ